MSIVLDGTTGITTPGLTNTGTETIVNLTTSGNTILGDASTDTLNVGNGGLVKDASGNVGIGTSSPTYQTQIYGTGQTTAALTDAGNKGGSLLLNTPTVTVGDGGALLIGAGGSGAKPFAAIKGLLADGGGNTTGNLAFSTRNATGDTALTERMRIDSSGNVGIGVTPPTIGSSRRALVIGGQAVASVYHYAGIGESAYNWYLDGSSVVKYATTNYAGTFEFNNSVTGGFAWKLAASGTAGNIPTFTQAMSLDSSGNLLVGTTSLANAERLSVVKANTGGVGVAFFSNTNNSSGDQVLRSALGANANNTSSYHFVGNTGTDKIYIFGNGNIQNVNNSYGALSDLKLKENIIDATPKLEKLNQVRIVNFNMIGDGQKQIGVIAQELEQIFPSMVDESPDRDAEGNDLGTTTKSVKYSVFVPMLIKALQEQQALIQTLTDRITALETPTGTQA
jgi:hypothetical protein